MDHLSKEWRHVKALVVVVVLVVVMEKAMASFYLQSGLR